MDNLFFRISLNAHTFDIRINQRNTLCWYSINDKYKTSLTFAKNTYANVSYKNIRFNGTVTKRNIWSVSLDLHTVFRKKHNSCYFETTDVKQNIDTTNNNDEAIYSEKVLCFYDFLINNFSELYVNLENKAEFKKQLCDDIEENYFDVKELDEVLMYEHYIDDDPDKEPIIEKTTVRDSLIDDYEDCFISFRQAEMDSKHIESVFTLENIIKEVPELSGISNTFLREELQSYLDEHNDELKNLDIYYLREDGLYDAGMYLYDAHQYFLFMKTLESRIEKVLLSVDSCSVVNKDEICSYFRQKYNIGDIPDDQEFIHSVKDYVCEYIKFYKDYNKFVSLFNSNNIEIAWDDKTLQLFKKYDKKEIPVDSQYFAEYEVYQYIMPYYRKHFLRKNSDKYKPVIEKLPDFISYAATVFEILFKYHILIDTEENVLYNEDGDMSSACEEIFKISN